MRPLHAISLVALLTLVGCGSVAPMPLATPQLPKATATYAATAYVRSVAEMAITDVTVTASEIDKGVRPEGFTLEGRLADDYRTRVSLVYSGFEPVAGAHDILNPNDDQIGQMHPSNGSFVVHLQTSPRQKPVKHVIEATERQAFITAVQKAINAKPQGQNKAGQSVGVVLGFARHVLTNPAATK